MSELDRTLGALQARRTQDEAERQKRRSVACEFLREFYEADIKPSKQLKEHGIESECDGTRLVLERPAEGHFSEGLLIVIGEQGEIDVGGKSLGRYQPADKSAKKSELIMEIITHFSL